MKRKELMRRIEYIESILKARNNTFDDVINEIFAYFEQLEQGILRDFENRISKLERRL